MNRQANWSISARSAPGLTSHALSTTGIWNWIGPVLFIELFRVRSWEEHLRQHRERQTGTDLQYLDAAAELSDPSPQTGHYLAAATREPAGGPARTTTRSGE